jgi:hypothetical protein
MRLAVFTLTTSVLALAAAMPAHAQSSMKNASDASKQTSMAVGAIGESGLKATSGVVAIPFGAVALGSGAVGIAANASGQTEVGDAFSKASASVSKDARKLVEFSNAPLTVTDDVIVRRPANPAPQAAPEVPFTPTPAAQ